MRKKALSIALRLAAWLIQWAENHRTEKAASFDLYARRRLRHMVAQLDAGIIEVTETTDRYDERNPTNDKTLIVSYRSKQ